MTNSFTAARETHSWYAGASGGVSGFGERVAAIGMARGHILLWRNLAAGGQVLFSHQQLHVAEGTATIWAVDGRVMAGLLVRRSQLIWLFGGLVGGRLTHGATTGLAEHGSGSLGSLGVGLCGDMWWAAGRHLRIGVGTNVVFFVPRAAFDVTGAGRVYSTPLPTVELHLSAGWEG